MIYAQVASERAVLEVAPGTRLDLIVRAELGAPDDGRDLVQSVDVERGVANPVPPVDQRDVLYRELGEPCLLEDRTRSTRVVDLVPKRHRQLIVIY